MTTARALDGTAAGITGRDVDPGWRYDIDAMLPELRPVVAAAVADLGLREDPDGSNDGPQLAKFKTGGLPWCAYALGIWYAEHEDGCPWGRLGSAYKIHAWAKAHGRILGVGPVLRPGDVALDLRPLVHAGRTRIPGHVALVVHVLPDGRICTVGGNEGNRVRGRVRRAEEFRYMLRPLPITG